MTLTQAKQVYSIRENEKRSRDIGLIHASINRALEKAVDTGAQVAIATMPTGVDIELVRVTRQVYKNMGSLVRLDEQFKGTRHYRVTLTIWLS